MPLIAPAPSASMLPVRNVARYGSPPASHRRQVPRSVYRAPAQASDARTAHTVWYTARAPAGHSSVKPAPRIQRLLSLRGQPRVCCVRRSTVTSVSEPFEHLPPSEHRWSQFASPTFTHSSASSALAWGTLDRGKHLNLLIHCHLQLAHRRDLRLVLQIFLLRSVAAVNSRLTCGCLGIGQHHEDYGCHRAPVAVESSAPDNRVRATRNRRSCVCQKRL